MSENCGAIAVVSIYGKFTAIRKPDSGLIACKTYVFIHSKLLSHKNGKQNYKISNTARHAITLSNGTTFAKKRLFFCKEMLTFQHNSIELQTRRGGGWLTLPPPPQNEPPKIPPRLRLSCQTQPLQVLFYQQNTIY